MYTHFQKAFTTLLTLVLFSLMATLAAQEKQQATLPEVKVKEVGGNQWTEIQEALNPEGPTLISFWATWCKPCIRELDNISDLYEDWTDEGIRVVAVSIDDSRSQARVPAFVNSRGWEFEVYSDLNGDLNRAMGVNGIVPYTVIVNKEGKIIYQHASYNPGDEENYYDIMLKSMEE